MVASMTVALFAGCGSKSDESDSGKVKLTLLDKHPEDEYKGYFEEATEGEEKVKHITEKGKEAGIQEEERYGKYGRKYYALVHTRESQEMILGELREYLADLTDE